MNEQQNMPPGPSIPNPESTGWSWGAFMLDPAFLIGIKKYKYLFWYLIMLVPFVGFLFYIGFKIYLGVKGREIASTSTYLRGDERRGFMKGLDNAGKITFFSSLIFLALWLVFFGVAFFGFLTSGFNFGGRN